MQEWTFDTLWNKAHRYFERAFEEDRNEDRFPFLASLGLEFLARAALARIHPALLADPQDPNNILYAFGFPATAKPKSIPAKTVYVRLRYVVEDFSEDDMNTCLRLAEMRNSELHTGAFAFADIKTGEWLASFYTIVSKITNTLGLDLSDVLGDEEGKAAETIIQEDDRSAEKEVMLRIDELKRSIAGLHPDELAARREKSAVKFMAARLKSGAGLFSRKCPVCNSNGALVGIPMGVTPARIKDGDIVSQSMFWPIRFECRVCEFAANGYQELRIIGLGDQIVDEDIHDPVDFLSIDIGDYVTDEMINAEFEHPYMNE